MLALEARDAAGQMSDPEAKLIMLSIAQIYEHLAARAQEAEAKKKDPEIGE